MKQLSDPLPGKATPTQLSFELAVTHSYKGPNIHAPRPAVRFEIAARDAEGLTPDTIAQASQRLLRLLPELDTLIDAELSSVGWANKASLNKFLLTEITAVLTFMLMRRVDEWISPLSSGSLESKSGFYLICEYRRSADHAKAAVRLALDLLASVCRPSVDEEKLRQKLAAFERRTKWRGMPNAACVLEEAEHRGIPVAISVAGPPILGLGCLQKRARDTTTSATGFLAVKLARDKVETARVLNQARIPVPEQIPVDSKEEAIAAARRIGFPVVVKPLDGNRGRGVSVKLASDEAVATAYGQAAAISSPVLVESYIEGFDHRLLVIDGELVAACRRIPGHVVGNGTDTIQQLLDTENADPWRDNRLMHKIKIDFDAKRMLEDEGLTLASIPESGKVVYLRSRANSSAGGSSVALTEQVHPDNRLLAVAAARALQLDIAGIDFITTDISRSYKETKGAVCEVNNSPGILDLHVYPPSGTGVRVGLYMMEMLFPPPSTGRIPIIAVCGDHFDDRLSHRIAHLLQVAGHDVGLATHEGLWIGGDLVATEDSANFDGARAALLHPSVSAAVIEVTTQSMLTEGLAFDHADVAVITDSRLKERSKDAASLIASFAGSVVEGGDLAFAACEALGMSSQSIKDALKANIETRESAPLLIRGLSTAAGEILLATPRNRGELETLSRLARSWIGSPSSPLIVHMVFTGDADLQAALDAELKAGSARLLAPDFDVHMEGDLSSIVFSGEERRAVILTDNMPYFRRRLKSST